jgi:ribonuclease HI
MYSLYFDGLFRGIPGNFNPTEKAGFMCYGWLILDGETIVARGHGAFARGKNATSNVAEYLALIEGLEALKDLGMTGALVEVCGDAQCVIDQMRGVSGVHSPAMKPLHKQAARLAAQFSALVWNWRPRQFNRLADQLTRRAMRQMRLDRSHYLAAVEAIHPAHNSRARSNRLLPVIDLRVYLPA